MNNMWFTGFTKRKIALWLGMIGLMSPHQKTIKYMLQNMLQNKNIGVSLRRLFLGKMKKQISNTS